MFEDSTFESTGRIRTRSRGWMIAAFTFNSAILATLILIPLIYPEALPRQWISFLMEAPTPPVPEPKPQVRPEHVNVGVRQIEDGHIFAPPTIPSTIKMVDRPETLPTISAADMDPDGGGAVGKDNPFSGRTAQPVVRQATTGPVRISGMVVEGMLIEKTVPVYPAIAKATDTQGTVVLQAIISRSGTIENLHVVSGPAMLQQAALDAVKRWRYRPFLLSGEPVEVETTVNVVFKLQ